MRMPRLNWFARSRMKLPMSRGPKLPAAKDTATMVMENITPVTPIIACATTDRIACAPSGRAPSTALGRSEASGSTKVSSQSEAWASPTAAFSSQIR